MNKLKLILKEYYEISVCSGIKGEKVSCSDFEYVEAQTSIPKETGLLTITPDLYDRLVVEFNEQANGKQKFYIDTQSHILKRLIKPLKKHFESEGKTVQLHGGFVVQDDVEEDRFIFLKYNVVESEPAVLFVVSDAEKAN